MENQEMELTFSDIIRIFKRRRGIFYATVLIVFIITVLYLLLFTKPIYKAETTIEYQGKTSTSSLSQYAGLASMAGIALPSSGSSDLPNELQRMKSDYVLGKIVDELNMVEKANNNKGLLAKIRKTDYKKRDFIDSLRQDLKITSIKDTSFVKISYESKNPTQAASIVNMVYDYYLEYDEQLTTQRSDQTIIQIKSVFNDLENQYNKMTKQLYDYKVENKISDNAVQTELIKYYEDTYLKLLKMDQDRQQLEITLETIEKTLIETSEEMKEIILTSSQANLSSLKNQLVNYQIELETLKLNQPNSPRIIELENSIKITQTELTTQQNKILNDNLKYLSITDRTKFQQYIQTKTQLELFDVTKEVYQQMLKVIDSEINKKSPIIYQYLQMLKEQKIIESKYNIFYNTLEQEQLKKSLYNSKFTIIENSYVPQRPISPNKKLTLAIGLVLGIFLGILLVFIKESSDKKLKDKREFESLFKEIDLNINKVEDAEKIYNYMYKYNFKKVGIIVDKNSTKQKRIINKLKELIKEVDNTVEFEEPKDEINLKTKIQKFEDIKTKEKAIIIFESIESPSYILYEEHMDKKIIFVEEKLSELQMIEETIKKEPKIVKAYIK
ncbi:Wzz/FepE/Etk N-terminal domain-containing protein [Oceanotoga sp. DSM 15011]|uniref:GumC family protein n=1 Tax=Oceanotoga sp. DSM 15011 TaxID=2984951 RepID=UPI0021F3D795|nr:GNVR domain-containing protein [Oceanotoga sp. DSM 15011]UYO99154.1 Wzz/FepE/Etk N-terminal domain-containing protein [Oceanotoga sp. DSM 15011]